MTTSSSLDGAFADALRSDPRVRRLADFARPHRLFLVGGCVRDAVLGRPVHDLDLVVEADGVRIAEAFAAAAPARLVRLGRERFAAFRLVDADGWIDLWDLEGNDLEADLWRRDFTINAVALDADSGALIDPTGGLGDLSRRLLRATRPEVFAEDPLRVLRLVRLALALPELAVDPATIDAARGAAPRLEEVAHERVRDELDRILGGRALRGAVFWLDELGLTPILFGARNDQGFRSLAQDEDGRSPVATIENATGVETHRLALHWAFLASSVGPDREAARQLLLQAAERRRLDRTAFEVALGLLRSTTRPDSAEPKRRLWLHGTGPAWAAALALGRALATSDGERDGWERLANWTLSLPDKERRQVLEPEPLLDGLDVQRILGIGPGPEVGAALAAIERDQIEGRISDRAGAERVVRERIVRREPG